MPSFNLEKHEITVKKILRNPPTAALYEYALRGEFGSAVASTGALIAMSGAKTGRSPSDKRIVKRAPSEQDVWWGPVNIPLEPLSFDSNRERALDYLNTRDQLFCIDGFAGWDARYRLKVRIVCARAYHALFMRNMLIMPTPKELQEFGDPDFTVFNAGQFPANRHTPGMSSRTTVDLSFEEKQLIILGTEYAGEMKKGVFTIMNYLMPKRGMLSMHCSATKSRDNDECSIMFGLSGTGKTTLSADPKRLLVGDDEHVWTDQGIFNIEGGCYAKVIRLRRESEPDIYDSIRFGTVLENVIMSQDTRQVDYDDTSVTENTRASYPLDFLANSVRPAVAGHPRDVIFLTCDAFGVLPPVSRLTREQAMYHFISGYTAKVAGTEVGVTDPQATFSPCFGGPFLVWHPAKYAELLAENINQHGSKVWLVNTGWSGGGFGVGSRMPIKVTRSIIDAIHGHALDDAPCNEEPVFGLQVPKQIPNVPAEVLDPRAAWPDAAKYDEAARKLAGLFTQNFQKYAGSAAPDISRGGPRT